jgi:hypothetical protein
MEIYGQKEHFPSMLSWQRNEQSKKVQIWHIETSKILENLIRKGYDLATIVHSLRQVYFNKYIDNLLVLLVGATNN